MSAVGFQKSQAKRHKDLLECWKHFEKFHINFRNNVTILDPYTTHGFPYTTHCFPYTTHGFPYTSHSYIVFAIVCDIV